MPPVDPDTEREARAARPLPAEAHILVVEDDGEMRTLIAKFLRHNGFRVTGARSGAEMWDTIALKRAFANIIDNAVNYGSSARVRLADQRQELVIHVDDAGPEVPEEQLESVFQPFCRLEHSRNRRTGGSGLGLAIARQAIGRHGGSVTLQNLTGGGLRASIRLPRPA
ncbi:ATP-binding protein [Roseomonas sp. ACRSG]|nr:ATP-binding protein [Roseomonas sp. ACRSG]